MAPGSDPSPEFRAENNQAGSKGIIKAAMKSATAEPRTEYMLALAA
jgi:hypothetical protein